MAGHHCGEVTWPQGLKEGWLKYRSGTVQAKEQQDLAGNVLQAVAGSALAPGPALAPAAAGVSAALQQHAAQQAAPAQQQTAAVGTPSGLNPISSLVSQAGGLLQNLLPQLGRRLLREQA